jgi:hypothetical protein
MRRRDFLQGGVGLIAASLSGTAGAQELTINPGLLERLRVYFCYGRPNLRRNIYSLLSSDPNHPIVQAYRQGVSVMKTRAADDPTSWIYQANIHGTTAPPATWPAGAPFATCEHGTMFFLSWHRVYLYFFERIVRAASGNPDFALPYWDYGLAGQSALPLPFRDAASPLFDGTRAGSVNAGNPLPPSAVTAANALSRLNFLGGGQFQGTLEGTPHGAVHVSIGGNMGNFAGAGHDPIFWLHHCNIDRLWEKWLSQGGGRVNPTGDATWMDTEYTFVDENKNFVTMSASDVLYTVSQLHYQYEDPRTCVPLYVVQASLTAVMTAGARSRVLASFVIARNVKPTPDQMRIDLRPEDSDTRERLAKMLSVDMLLRTVESGARYLLTFEGVQTEAPLDGYFEVYLGLPRDSRPDFNSPYYVGNLTLFGADAESRRSMKSRHAGHGDFGMQVTLDVTDALKRMVERGDVGRGEMSVTLVPVGMGRSPNDRFTFDAKASPRIESILLTIEKDE